MPSFMVVPPNVVTPPPIHRHDRDNITQSSQDLDNIRESRIPVDEYAVEVDHDIEIPVSPIGVPEYLNAFVEPSIAMPEVRRSSTFEKGVKATHALHPGPSYLSERTRRPSAVRLDSAAETISIIKDVETSPTIRTQTTNSSAGILNLQYAESATVSGQLAKKQLRLSILRFAALCWCFFMQGWNDGSVGPLLPVIQSHYKVGFTVVSSLFVVNCTGCVVGAGANVWLNERIGFGKVMVLGSLLQMISYTIQSPAPPFPVFVMSYFIAGFGMSFQNAQANGFVGSLKKNKHNKLMMLHASYGLGAFCSPLVATHFSQTRHWSFHFIISAGIAVSNVIVLTTVFRFKRQEDLLLEVGQEPGEESLDTAPRANNMYRQIFQHRAVHFLAIFALIYVGTEVTIGGWMVTFIIRERGGGLSAGYISSGFFGGLTLGRLVLMYVNKKVGEHTVVFLYVLLSIALEITIWFVPSIIENGVAISFIGILLGPLFPILVGHATRILPAPLLTGSVGWIGGVGNAGSAALPFITGILASKYGIKSLQPFLVAMMCVLVGLWTLVPKARRVA